MTVRPCAGPFLSWLVDEDSTADNTMIKHVLDVTESPQKFKSGYDRAIGLHRAICLSGPMGNNLASGCAWQIAYITKGLAPVIPYSGPGKSVRPRTCLVDSLSQAHWLVLVGMVKEFMSRVGERFDCGSDETPLADSDQMEDDIIIVEILIWMTRQRADFLDKFCRSKNITLVKD